MMLRVLETVEAHCGYHFPWSLSNFLPLYGGSATFFLFLDKFHFFFFFFSMASWKNLLFFICSADFHDYHHRLLYTKSGNYSSTFVYMDWWDFFNYKCSHLSIYIYVMKPFLFLVRIFGTDKGYRKLKVLKSMGEETLDKENITAIK